MAGILSVANVLCRKDRLRTVKLSQNAERIEMAEHKVELHISDCQPLGSDVCVGRASRPWGKQHRLSRVFYNYASSFLRLSGSQKSDRGEVSAFWLLACCSYAETFYECLACLFASLM